MITVPVNASNNYNIYIDSGLLKTSGEIIEAAAGGERAFLITDSNVDDYYGDVVAKSLGLAGYEVIKHVFPAGEESKNINTLSGILSHMASAHISRKDVAVALGGGVVGDMAGFASAVYMRGIKYVQLPTTVLSAVDSSVGGKTAVDLPEGKNLAGAFHQPSAVICDTATFNTLSERDFNNGFAEVIKYAVIADGGLFPMLKESNIDEIIKRCVEIKAEIVGEDEFESGRRQVLNFGHSIGHAYEKLSDYELLHGEAVACGMVKITEIAEKRGLCSPELTELLKNALKGFNLPLYADYSPQETVRVMKMDKKASGDYINLILPLKAGEVVIEKTEIRRFEDEL